jgi:hypothetical protein
MAAPVASGWGLGNMPSMYILLYDRIKDIDMIILIYERLIFSNLVSSLVPLDPSNFTIPYNVCYPCARIMSWLRDFMGFTSSLPNLFVTKGFIIVVVYNVYKSPVHAIIYGFYSTIGDEDYQITKLSRE